MVRITKVYTRKGDKGTTRRSKSSCLSKSSLTVELLGLLDELNSFLGFVTILLDNEKLLPIKNQLMSIQNTLFDIGAYLCQSQKFKNPNLFFSKAVKRLEESMDEMNAKLKPLQSFILPGGNEISVRLHMARTVCRRAECKLVAWGEEEKNTEAIPYLNRLSDWLFVSARYVLSLENIPEELWVPIWERE